MVKGSTEGLGAALVDSDGTDDSASASADESATAVILVEVVDAAALLILHFQGSRGGW